MTSWTRFWLAALFVGCSPSVVCYTESFVDFGFFSAIFISWLFKDIRNAPHRRLEIKEISEQHGSDPPRLTRHTHLGNDLRVIRLTCKQWCYLTYNNGVSFRNRSDCWSQWPAQCSQLWSHCLLVWIWIPWKFIHHRMSVSNGWVLSLKIRFLLRICVSQTRTRLSSHFLSGV